MADFNISGILDALTLNNTQRVQTLEQGALQQATDTATLEKMLTANVDATAAAVEERTRLASVKAVLEARNGEIQERAQAIVGLNPDDVNNDFVKSVARYDQFSQQAQQASARVAEAGSVGLLDNPVSWLFNQLELPSLQRQADAAAAGRDAAAKDIAARTTMLSQHRNSVIPNAAAEAKEYNLALAQATAREANLKLDEERAKNLSAISSRRLNELNLRNNIFDAKESTLNKVLTVSELMDRRDANKLQMAGIIEERQMRIDKKKAEQAEIDAANANLQVFADLTGGQALTVDRISKLTDKRQKDFYSMVAMTGSLGADMGAVLRNLQSTPGAMETIQATNPQVAMTIKKLGGGVSSYLETFRGKPGPDGKTPSDKDALEMALTTYQDEVARSTTSMNFAKPLNSSAWDRQYNPYRADHKLMLSLIDTGRASFLKDNLVTQTAKTVNGTLPATQDAFTGDDESRVLKAIIARVASKEMPAKAAASQIVQYYSAAAQIQREETQYGLFMLPPQNKYIVGLEGSDYAGRPFRADLLNQASVEALITGSILTEQKKLENYKTQALGVLLPAAQLGTLLTKEVSELLKD